MVNRALAAPAGPLKPSLRDATFLLGAAQLSQLPPDNGAEVAFAGRSNAGKSSALNAITGRKGLARTSKTPGRTQQINVFALDSARRLVDLPGYGFARASTAARERWTAAVEGYLRRRRSLRGLVLIMDVRHIDMPSDEALLAWAARSRMPLHVLLSKADKLGRGAARSALLTVRERLENQGVQGSAQLFSALAMHGVEECQARIGQWLEMPTSQSGEDGGPPISPAA